MAKPPKYKAIKQLRRALDSIPKLKQLQRDSPEFKKWLRNTEVAIVITFGDKSRHIQDFKRINYVGVISLMGTPDSVLQEAYVRGLGSAAPVLESMIDEIEEYWEGENQTSPSSVTQENERTNTNEVFVIHGRDEGTRAIVARFLEQLRLKPVILDEQSNQGLTIIEKFERHAKVEFAVALLTPDDTGSLQGDGSNLNPRARQNVIFELGFFIGKLGREGVCALTKGTVEIPSDYAGVVYITLDDGGWKMNLIRELKNAGFDVDANRAL